MAKTISNLLVGIGFDLDKKSTQGVSSGIDSIKSKALKLGAVVAGAFGIKALTSDFASAKDDLGKFAQVFGVTADDVNAFGNALRLEGGSLNGFMSQLAGLEKFRAGLAQGDAGFIEAAGRAGLDTQGLINATNATEAYLELANQFQSMTAQQRINAAAALGLDDSSIRLLSKGRAGIEAVVKEQKKMRPITDAMTDSAAEFNDELQDLSTNIGGFADVLSEKLLPQINGVVAGLNDWIEANRSIINSGIGDTIDSIGDFAISVVASLGLMSNESESKGQGGNTSLVDITNQRDFTKYSPLGIGLMIGDEIKNAIGIDNLRSMAVAPKSAYEFIANGAKSMTNGTPIVIHNNTILDGQVIDTKIIKVVGGMADQAVQDLSSTEGG